MATISGRLLFDRTRAANPPGSMAGIANVAIVLLSISSNESLAVLTDPIGSYSFTNVPDGQYLIIESFGAIPAVPTPGNFSTAADRGTITAAVPPISYATNPPAGATNLDCVSRNTIPIKVESNQNITNQFILNGPVTYKPIETIMDSCTSLSHINLITDAYSGTMGTFPPGTPTDTSVLSAPFPQNVPDYNYVLTQPDLYVPDAGEYTVQNILTNTNSTRLGAWWRIADRTTGNETGHMMVINGDIPGSIFFTTNVNVTPHTHYLFSAWILNLFKAHGWAEPRLGVAILDQNGTVIYRQTLGALIPVNTTSPEWRQIGTAVYSANNTSLTVQFLSEGPEEIGNDYAIDDITFQQITIPVFTPVKSISTGLAAIGDGVTYTVTLTNTCQSPLVNVFFIDMVPDGLLFVPNSVTINGVKTTTIDPNTGFNIPDIPGGGVATITFDAVVGAIPIPNPVLNTADMRYSYTPVLGGILKDFDVTSNTVELLVSPEPGIADLSITKTASPEYVLHGTTVTYTFEVSNQGPDTAENAVLFDEITPVILNPEYSLNGVDFYPWASSYIIGNMPPHTKITVIVRGIVDYEAVGSYINTAKIISSTNDPNLENNISSSTIEVVPAADITVTKVAAPPQVTPNENVTYTIEIINQGPDEAQDVELTDITPSEILYPEFSLDDGITFYPWTGSYNIGNLPVNGFQRIIIQGRVDENTPYGTVQNTSTVNTTTPDPDISNNTSQAQVNIRPQADLFIEKSALPGTLHPGEILIFTITVINQGPNLSQDVLISDILPYSVITDPQFSINGIPQGPWTGSYNLGTLRAMDEVIITITCTIAENAIGNFTNTAAILASTPDPDLSNNLSTADVEIEAMADVVIDKSAYPTTVRPGESLTYTLLITNSGPSAAENVIVADSIPAGIVNPQFSVDGSEPAPWEGSYTIGNLPRGGTVTITITGTVAYIEMR